MTKKSIVTRLEAIRKAQRLSRLDLAVRAGVTESTIVRAERPTTSTPAVQARSLEKIAAALEVPIAELLKVDDARQGRPSRPPMRRHNPDILFVQDLALELRSTARRIRELLRDEPHMLPEPLPAIDHRPRWSRVIVDRWLEKENRQRELDARALARARR